MDEEADARVRRALRPRLKPLAVAVALNLLLAAAALGVPYVRGRLRAAAARERFAVFAACLWAGRPVDRPGLGWPPGKRLRFASHAIEAPSDWPRRCHGPLRGVAPERAWFVFPSVSQAEERVRAAVELVDGELSDFAARRRTAAGRIAVRPLQAVDELAGAVALLARAADVADGLEAPAIRYEGPAGLVKPTRVPLKATRDAWLRIRGRGGRLDAAALDARGFSRKFSRVLVGGGGLEQQRIGVPDLVRGFVDAADQPWLVWAMDEDRCADEDDRCAQRASGVAPLGFEASSAPEPAWLAAHPRGRIDRSVRVGPGPVVDVLARRPDGGAELRRFALPPSEQGAASGDGPPPPHEPVAQLALEGIGPDDDATLLPGDAQQPGAAWTHVGADGGIHLRAIRAGGTHRTVASLPAVPDGDDEDPVRWTAGCRTKGRTWLAIGGAARASIAPFEAGGAESAPAVELAVARPPHGARPTADAVRILCDDERAQLLAQSPGRGGALRVVGCRGASCRGPRRVAIGVARFDAVRAKDAIIVAWTDDGHRGAVRVGVLGPELQWGVAPRVVAPCWSDGEGLCGAPVVDAHGNRVVVGARDGSDLLAVESTDQGKTWQPMRGLKKDE